MPFKSLDIYLVFDDPIPYKDLIFFPVKMRDYYLFGVLSESLLLEKNSVPDPKVISMSYLEYLYSIYYKELQDESSKEKGTILTKLDVLLKLCLGKKDDTEFKIEWGTNNKEKPLFKIDDKTYNTEDFDKIKEIIAEQNELELPDETIQKSVRDEIEKARRYKQRINGSKMANLEDQIISLAVYTGWELDSIYNLSIRKFMRAIRRANHILYQNMYLQASLSGFVTFKDKSILSGWLSSSDEEDKFSDVKVNLEELQGKVDFSSAK